MNAWRGVVRAVLTLQRLRSWSGWSGRLLAGFLAVLAASGMLWWSHSLATESSNDTTGVGTARAVGDLPSARIVICGAQRGRLEPCGCSSPQRGGLDRLAALLQRLKDAGPVEPSVVQFGPALGRSDRRIDALKFATFHAAWRHMGVNAVHAGSHDLTVGPVADAPTSEPAPVANTAPFRPSTGDPQAVLPVHLPVWAVPANLTLLSDPPDRPLGARPAPRPAWHVVAPGVRSALLLGPQQSGRLRAAGVIERFVEPSVAARSLVDSCDALWLLGVEGDAHDVAAVRTALRGRSAVVIHLHNGPSEALPTSLAPAPALRGEGREYSGSLGGGLPPLVTLADRGRDVLVIDLWRRVNDWRVDVLVKSLLPPLPQTKGSPRSDGSPLSWMSTRLARHHAQVRDAQLLLEIPRLPPAAGRSHYVGSDACARCHPSHAEEWRRSAHAQALEVLVGRGRAHDPECVVCHATGFERTPGGEFIAGVGGFRTPASTPEFGGVGCEACHGAGGSHVEEPRERAAARREGFRSRPGLETCLQCHDADNSPAFAGQGARHYLPRVDHRDLRARNVLERTEGGVKVK